MSNASNIIILPSYFILGAVAGVIGGLMGLGGGIVIVPALLLLFIWQGFPQDFLMQVAVATSLTTIVFTSISSAYAHHQRGAVLWQQVFLLAPGIVIGAVIGAAIADYLPSDALKILFGVFEIMVAIQIALEFKPNPARKLPQKPAMLMAGGVIGTASTILGIGGGTLTVPFFLWCNVHIRKAVASSAACGLPISLAGACAMVVTGWNTPGLPQDTFGYVYWPAALLIVASSVLFAPLGARLAHSLPVATLKKIFAIVLFLIGLRMVF